MIGELKLLKSVQSQYKDLSFDGLKLQFIDFYTEDFLFENCCFSNYNFYHCIFDFTKFPNTTFINCQFTDCEWQNDDATNCAFYHCSENNKTRMVSIIEASLKQDTQIHQDVQIDIQRNILESYFKVDGKTPRMKMVSKLRESFPIASKQFNKEFEELVKKGYLIYSGDKSFISTEGIQYYNCLLYTSPSPRDA